jgi:hypothetical protein
LTFSAPLSFGQLITKILQQDFRCFRFTTSTLHNAAKYRLIRSGILPNLIAGFTAGMNLFSYGFHYLHNKYITPLFAIRQVNSRKFSFLFFNTFRFRLKAVVRFAALAYGYASLTPASVRPNRRP